MLHRFHRRYGIVTLALLTWCMSPRAADSAPAPTIDHGWFTTLPNNGPTLGYFTITNKGGDPRLITGFSSPGCRTLKLEEAHGGGLGAETGMAGVTVPGKGQMAFVRGGYHLVCERSDVDMTIGQTIPVTISFLSGTPITTPFEIRPLPKR